MKVSRFEIYKPNPPQPVFKGIRQGSKDYMRDYGKVTRERGFFNGKRLDVYSAYDKEGKLVNKLYYLADNVGNWLKSKLVYFDKDGKKYKQITSEVG